MNIPTGYGDQNPNMGAATQADQEKMMEWQMRMLMESCPAKCVISGTMGFGLGAMLGLFMSSFDYQSSQYALDNVPMKEQIRQSFKDMGKKSWSSAKNFAVVGAVFSGTECVIEKYRAKHDLYNSMSAGCVTGAILAARAGPKATALGCAGFAAFSTAIDYYMSRE